LGSTATNFLYCVPLVAAVSLFALRDAQASPVGVGLAIASGAVASALGYVVWYVALRGLTTSRAATVQLSVPIIAAFGGVVLLAEDVSLRLLIASVATLGGIWIVLVQRDRDANVR
jgi:drug/metabolite transporter (DMT)-like permease